MIKYLSLASILLILFSCSKDPKSSYPVLYTLHHIEQSDEGHYLVETEDDISSLPTNIGSFGSYKGDLKLDILEGLRIAFNLKEIELLDEDSLRINGFVDDEEFDLKLGYSVSDGNILIDSLEGTILTYEKEDDQFVVCGATVFALAGPNVSNPAGPDYFLFSSSECPPGFVNEDYAYKLLSEYTYQPLDTLGVILTRLIYK